MRIPKYATIVGAGAVLAGSYLINFTGQLQKAMEAQEIWETQQLAPYTQRAEELTLEKRDREASDFLAKKPAEGLAKLVSTQPQTSQSSIPQQGYDAKQSRYDMLVKAEQPRTGSIPSVYTHRDENLREINHRKVR